eukprot:5908058-Heterocapsa_arctica.AAC.1
MGIANVIIAGDFNCLPTSIPSLAAMVQDGTVVDLVAGGCALADRPVPSDTFVQAHGLGTRRQFIFGSPGLATRLITADTDPENAYK